MMGGEGMNEQKEERSVGNKDNESGTCEERREEVYRWVIYESVRQNAG